MVIAFEPKVEGVSVAPLPRLTILVARDARDLVHALASFSRLLAGVGLATIIVAALALVLVVRRTLRPVGALSASIASIAPDDLSRRLDPSGVPTEFLPTVVRTNDLLARIEGAFSRERAFAQDVAHELRTPLA